MYKTVAMLPTGTLPDMTLGTFSIVPLMVEAVDVPVMAAGGIYALYELGEEQMKLNLSEE